ncbi:hypothetical protein TgHK011_009803 [Trichoderma gracile]|nr:hypothetical protein TgHK011_009803 [Trichoderma gracile]
MRKRRALATASPVSRRTRQSSQHGFQEPGRRSGGPRERRARSSVEQPDKRVELWSEVADDLASRAAGLRRPNVCRRANVALVAGDAALPVWLARMELTMWAGKEALETRYGVLEEEMGGL